MSQDEVQSKNARDKEKMILLLLSHIYKPKNGYYYHYRKLPSIDRLEPGTNPPDEINVVKEIPKDSNLIYEMDSESGEIFVDRILYPEMIYPLNYGFIPQTRESSGIDDGKSDPINVFILGNYSFYPKSVISCRPVGVFLTEDQGGIDSKIIAVPLTKIDPTFLIVEDIDDVPEYLKRQLKHFIEHHKNLEEQGKYLKIKGWEGMDAAKLKGKHTRRRL